MSSGFIKAGFKPLLLIDNDKNCCETLRYNHEEYKDIVKCGSFLDIDYNAYNDVDMMMGGVPCQSFSQAGKRKGLDDKRGNLLVEFLKIINKAKPKMFLIENVKGLLTHKKGETFKSLIMPDNYDVTFKVLNSNDYDVPQKRERLILIGKYNINNGDIEYKFPDKIEYKPVLQDVLINVPPSVGYKYAERKREIMDMVCEGGCWINLPIDIQKEYMKKSFFSGGGKRGIARRLAMNKPSLTIMTSPCQKQTERCHPSETRPLNIRESARIQTFPDNYNFIGSISSQYKQIGNAVPVNMAYYLANSILLTLDNNSKI